MNQNVEIVGDCKIGKNVKFLGFCRVENSEIDDGTIIKSSYITDSKIGKNCQIGPYANLRKGSVLCNNVKLGSYVEVKNSTIGEFSKVPHFAYIGDAEIGMRCNIGCGVVFANYDGKVKSRTTLGNDVFVGCNANLVAPVNIADSTYICAGTTVTRDTKVGDFVIGRVRQENKTGSKDRYH